jgi:hypothetical protein
MTETGMFIDMGFSQRIKKGQDICGDVFKYSRIPGEQRLVTVLSDGLGSGVKANIQASMCATMALEFTRQNLEMQRSAEIIMQVLPVCQVRKISYATFTIVDTGLNRNTHVVGNGQSAIHPAQKQYSRGTSLPGIRAGKME